MHVNAHTSPRTQEHTKQLPDRKERTRYRSLRGVLGNAHVVVVVVVVCVCVCVRESNAHNGVVCVCVCVCVCVREELLQ
jgi:Na+/melibiose symporter-like transporter